MLYIGPKNILARNVKYLRTKKLRKNIEDTAKFIGITKGTISKIENGKAEGAVETRLKIAKACGVALSDLYREDLIPPGVKLDGEE